MLREQVGNHISPPPGGGMMQGSGTGFLVAGIHIRAPLHQQLHDLDFPGERGIMEWCGSGCISDIDWRSVL